MNANWVANLLFSRHTSVPNCHRIVTLNILYFYQMRYVLSLALLTLLTLIACTDQKKAEPNTPPATDSLAILIQQVMRDSTNPELWQGIYQLQLDKGDTGSAIVSLQNYTLLSPQDGNGWLELAWLLADTKDKRALIITDSLKMVKDPDISTRAAYISGVYFSNIGRDDKAVNIFDSIISTNYTYLDAYIEKGIIQHDKKQYTEAIKTFQQALKVNSSTAEIYFWISKCYEGLGNAAEAADWKRKYEGLR
jgi:tetratricopeptide (TPR) repeat protein